MHAQPLAQEIYSPTDELFAAHTSKKLEKKLPGEKRKILWELQSDSMLWYTLGYLAICAKGGEKIIHWQRLFLYLPLFLFCMVEVIPPQMLPPLKQPAWQPKAMQGFTSPAQQVLLSAPFRDWAPSLKEEKKLYISMYRLSRGCSLATGFCYSLSFRAWFSHEQDNLSHPAFSELLEFISVYSNYTFL